MKKLFCILLCFILTAALIPMVSAAAPETISVDFFTEGWTQEQVSGSLRWRLSTEKAEIGGEKSEVTRLISPVMDLSGLTRKNLVFCHEMRKYYQYQMSFSSIIG